MDADYETKDINDELNEKKQAKNKNKEERQIVVFKIGNEEFGVDINEVWKIIRMEQITKIPNTEAFIKGVINLRGGIVVIIDLTMKLGMMAKETNKDTRIIIIEIKDNTIGMVVDSATEMMTITSDKIAPAPPLITQKINASYIEGVAVLGERLLILLDLAKVLDEKDIESVAQTVAH